jgi:hypothetical protein
MYLVDLKGFLPSGKVHHHQLEGNPSSRPLPWVSLGIPGHPPGLGGKAAIHRQICIRWRLGVSARG